MKSIISNLKKLSEKIKRTDLREKTVDLDKLILESQEEKGRPLYNATPSTIPGTWVEEDGEVIKTSKD